MGYYRPEDRYDRFGKYSYEETGYIGENKSSDHVGISLFPCPFSTQAIKEIGSEYTLYQEIFGNIDIYKHIKVLLKDYYTVVPDGTDYVVIEGTTLYIPDDLVDHTYNDKVYYLQTAYRGNWGYVCTFPGCPFENMTNRNYFYV